MTESAEKTEPRIGVLANEDTGRIEVTFHSESGQEITVGLGPASSRLLAGALNRGSDCIEGKVDENEDLQPGHSNLEVTADAETDRIGVVIADRTGKTMEFTMDVTAAQVFVGEVESALDALSSSKGTRQCDPSGDLPPPGTRLN